MRLLTAALLLSLGQLVPAAPSTAAGQQADLTDTRTALVAAAESGIVGFRIARYEERPGGGFALASGHVFLQAKPAGAKRWRLVPKSRTVAYKGRAMLFYRKPTKPGLVRAVSKDPGYDTSYSKPVRFPLR